MALVEDAINQMARERETLASAAGILLEALRSGHKVMVAGNGGSAAEAQHFAAELVGRFKKERRGYAVISLAADTSILTAVGNDYGYEAVFERQVEALGQRCDALVVYTTSGESENIVRACRAAAAAGVRVVAVTGGRPNRVERLADVSVRVPLLETDTIQELQMVVTHVLCDVVEATLDSTTEPT